MPNLACVAGEPSGDLIAAPVFSALQQIPSMAGLDVYGIGGKAMQAEGFRSLWPMETLSVRGYVEALRQLPAILRLRSELIAQLLDSQRPDLFMGIDAPDFNLGVELRLKEAGIPTIHFVSPSIWAWRGSRIKKIKRAVDRVLCLFPFEPEIYEKAGIAASYVGHPMASEIPEIVDTAAAKKKMNGGLEGLVIAVLPGSRSSEIELIGPVFFETIALIAGRLAGQKLHFVVPIATPHLRPAIESLRTNLLIAHPEIDLILLDGQADLALAAADVVLIASGTATLQAALWKKPMVISYKVPWLTAQIMKRQGYLPYVGLPNILSGEFVVPELLQDAAKPGALADAVLSWLDRPAAVQTLQTRFEQLHLRLKRPTGLLVAQVIEQTLRRSGVVQ
ncbi:MAG: lipid-A-disaccharide synthase [Limnohabitans sp.]|nr:lipid-A-disaccharide synthase [Limnohabitans sp.]